MPKVTDPPRFGLAVVMPLRPEPFVWDAPARPVLPRAPAATAPAPRATPPARKDCRPNDCDIATPQGFDPKNRSDFVSPEATAAGYNSVTVLGWQHPYANLGRPPGRRAAPTPGG